MSVRRKRKKEEEEEEASRNHGVTEQTYKCSLFSGTINEPD